MRAPDAAQPAPRYVAPSGPSDGKLPAQTTLRDAAAQRLSSTGVWADGPPGSAPALDQQGTSVAPGKLRPSMAIIAEFEAEDSRMKALRRQMLLHMLWPWGMSLKQLIKFTISMRT